MSEHKKLCQSIIEQENELARTGHSSSELNLSASLATSLLDKSYQCFEQLGQNVLGNVGHIIIDNWATKESIFCCALKE